MTEISDLKRRVEAVGEKFGRLAEQEDSYGERLTGLLNAVEEGFAQSQRETQKLKTELDSAYEEVKKLTGELESAKYEMRQRSGELDDVKQEREKLASELDGARDESRQLRSMLLTLLEAVEGGGNLDPGAAMRKLESRIDRIVTSTDGKHADGPALAAPVTHVSALPAAAVPAEAKSRVADEPGPRLRDVSTPKPEAAPAAPAGTAPDMAETAAEKIVASVLDPTPLDEPKAPPKPAKADVPERKSAEPPSDDDLSAVNKIIQRISLLTGEFVEPSHKRSAAAEEKPVPSLKVGNGAGAAGEAGSGADKPPAEDESTVKTS
jgi:hypothetical protein